MKSIGIVKPSWIKLIWITVVRTVEILSGKTKTTRIRAERKATMATSVILSESIAVNPVTRRLRTKINLIQKVRAQVLMKIVFWVKWIREMVIHGWYNYWVAISVIASLRKAFRSKSKQVLQQLENSCVLLGRISPTSSADSTCRPRNLYQTSALSAMSAMNMSLLTWLGWHNLGSVRFLEFFGAEVYDNSCSQNRWW